MNLILPSLLAVPPLELRESIESCIALGLHHFHIDMMDFQYTHNFGLSMHTIEDIQTAFPNIELDVHLMTRPTSRPLLKKLISLNIKNISVHWDTLTQEDQTWLCKQDINLRLAYSPDEPLPENLPCNRVLILCVNPGFSHQEIQEAALEKANIAKQRGLDVMVDGGINQSNITSIMALKPEHLVIGGGLMRLDDTKKKAFIQQIMDLQG